MRIVFFALMLFAGEIFSQEKHNIIIINVDDMGWLDLGFMGSNFYFTPNTVTLDPNLPTFPQILKENGYANI